MNFFYVQILKAGIKIVFFAIVIKDSVAADLCSVSVTN